MPTRPRPLRLEGTGDLVGPVVETTVPAPPGPGGRVQRSAGQAGGAVLLLDLVFAFGWLGADDWTVEQASAVTAAVVFGLAALHNLAEHFRSRKATAALLEVEGLDPARPPSPSHESL